jgi:hypothetical protein
MSMAYDRTKSRGSYRPTNIRNKVSTRFLEDIYVAWQKHGPEVLDYLGKRKPVELARLVAGCLPKELIFENVALDGQSPEELDAVILTIKQHLLHKPNEPLLIEGETIHESDRSSAGAADGDIGTSGSAQTATARRR